MSDKTLMVVVVLVIIVIAIFAFYFISQSKVDTTTTTTGTDYTQQGISGWNLVNAIKDLLGKKKSNKDEADESSPYFTGPPLPEDY